MFMVYGPAISCIRYRKVPFGIKKISFKVTVFLTVIMYVDLTVALESGMPAYLPIVMA